MTKRRDGDADVLGQKSVQNAAARALKTDGIRADVSLLGEGTNVRGIETTLFSLHETRFSNVYAPHPSTWVNTQKKVYLSGPAAAILLNPDNLVDQVGEGEYVVGDRANFDAQLSVPHDLAGEVEYRSLTSQLLSLLKASKNSHLVGREACPYVAHFLGASASGTNFLVTDSFRGTSGIMFDVIVSDDGVLCGIEAKLPSGVGPTYDVEVVLSAEDISESIEPDPTYVFTPAEIEQRASGEGGLDD